MAKIMSGVLRSVCMAAVLVMSTAVWADAPITLTFEQAQTSVLDPAAWTKVLPDDRYFDALRPLLIRFPGAADALYAKMKEGAVIENAELVLEWEKQEGANPQRGRSGWGSEDAYNKEPGQWSAEARAVMKPWSVADTNLGPTADAYINGLGFWKHSTARGDGSDRGTGNYGPLPLHASNRVARLDVTAALTDPAWGKTPGERLRALEEKGFAVTKHELMDLKYNSQDGGWFDVYSWRVETGYMRIWVKAPVLVVTLRPDPAGARQAGALPKPLDFPGLVAELRRKPDGVSPMAPPADVAARVAAYTGRPDGMPDWQWQRLQDLHRLGGYNLGRIDMGPLLGPDPGKRDKYLADLLTTAPHRWDGHLTSDYALAPTAYPDLFPPAFQDYLRLFWTAWLHPETVDTENPRQRSYFRSYNWTLGTQNFNFNSIAGGYLASQFLGASNSLRDAQYGLENILLRNYMFYNGANQEVGDTYYQALSVAAIQMLAKYARHPFDRLQARIGSERQVEQLASMYSPAIRRITHPMGRGEMKYQCAFQDGPYFALHTLSPNGVLMDTDSPANKDKYGVPLFGTEGPPGRMAALAPWADSYWTNVVDGKALPWLVTARWWHMLPDNALASEWHINYLARHYSLASRSEDGNPVTHVTAQWRRRNAPVGHMEDLSTLQLSFGGNARVEQAMASWGIVQDRNKLIAMKALPPKGFLTFPPNPDYAGGWRAKDASLGKDAFNALQASAIIIAFGDVSQREVWIGERKSDKLSGASSPPITDPKYHFEQHLMTTGTNSEYAKSGDLITIKDGVSYVALIPLTINPLARDQEVEVAYEWPVLYIHSFIYRGAEAISQDKWYGAERKGSAGFIVELGDESEYGSFDKFREHIRKASAKVQWNEAQQLADMEYKSGEDTLAMGFRPWVMPQWNATPETVHAAVYRRVNGRWPYLPDGIHRDTPWSIQGQTGHLEKNGATLDSEPGYRTWLLAEPISGIVTAFNPLPDPIFWRLKLPAGGTVRADGRLGLLRVQADHKAGRLTVDYQLKPGQETRPDIASSLILGGWAKAPSVTFNGRDLGRLSSTTIDGGTVWLVPLSPAFKKGRIAERLAMGDEKWNAIEASGACASYYRDWYAVGPFSSGGYAGENFQLKDFGPEKGLDLQAIYTGLKTGAKEPEETPVRWRALLKPGEPALSAEPVEFRNVFDPNGGVIAYAAASIVSDADRTVQLLTGGDERLAVWLNGERVVFNRGWRIAYKDQDRVFVKLHKGENPLLLKLGHGFESWRLYFRLADEWGLSLRAGVQFRGANGLSPASP